LLERRKSPALAEERTGDCNVGIFSRLGNKEGKVKRRKDARPNCGRVVRWSSRKSTKHSAGYVGRWSFQQQRKNTETEKRKDVCNNNNITHTSPGRVTQINHNNSRNQKIIFFVFFFQTLIYIISC
jgi:hypothetical protein